MQDNKVCFINRWFPGRRDLLVSTQRWAYSLGQACLSLPFGCRRTRTTEVGPMPSGRRDILVPIRTPSRPGGLSYGDITRIETGRALLPEEIGTRMSLLPEGSSRPGGLSYRDIACSVFAPNRDNYRNGVMKHPEDNTFRNRKEEKKHA